MPDVIGRMTGGREKVPKLKNVPPDGHDTTVGATLHEEILVKTYFVDQEVKAYSHDLNNPVFSALIHLHGKPSVTGASATSAEIHFYPDGDTRISVPTYNEHQKRIDLYAPLSVLPEYMATLSGEGDLMCGYLEARVGPEHNGYLRRLAKR